jgi:hypothetical protein
METPLPGQAPGMARSLRILLLLVVAALLVVPSSAAGKRYSATVIAPAAADSAGRLTLPLLLSPRAELRLKRPVIAPVVPKGAKPVRWGTGHLALAELRPGDRLTVDLRGRRARSLTLQRSGSADNFDRVATQLRGLNAAVARTTELATPVATASSYQRDQLRAVRDQISDLQGQLDAVDADVQTSLTRLAAVRPRQQRRHDAVAAAQAAYEQQLTGVRDAAKAARAQSELAAEGLDAVAEIPGSNDGTANPVTGPVPIELPFGTTSTVSDLLRTLVALSDQLGLAAPPLVG